MNEAHFHMVVNHFPIIGTILGLGILIVGYFQRNNSVKNTAYILFIITAIFAAISMATGEGAEEMVENMPNIGHKIIHNHEEMAEKLAVILYLLGIVSIAGLYTNIKNRSQAKLVSILAIIIGAVAIFFAQQTGTTGGEIRHTEIRSNFSNNEKEEVTIENKEEDR